MENVITLGILIGLLYLFCPPSSLFCFENSKNTRNELARPGMGTIFLVKRASEASEASEAFSLVMKTHNCLRLRGLTRNTCPTWRTAYVSSHRIDTHVFQSRVQRTHPLRG